MCAVLCSVGVGRVGCVCLGSFLLLFVVLSADALFFVLFSLLLSIVFVILSCVLGCSWSGCCLLFFLFLFFLFLFVSGGFIFGCVVLGLCACVRSIFALVGGGSWWGLVKFAWGNVW